MTSSKTKKPKENKKKASRKLKTTKLPTFVSQLKGALRDVWASKRLLVVLFLLHGFLIILLSSNPNSENGQLFATLTMIIFSLAYIYAARHASDGEIPTVRDSIYRGSQQFVPFLLTLGILTIQLIPLSFGLWLYYTVVHGGIASGATEELIFLSVMGLLSALSLYWLVTTLNALFVVALPEMTPLDSFKHAKRIVAGRRIRLFGRYILILILAGFIVYPILLLLPGALLLEYNVVQIAVAFVLPLVVFVGYRIYKDLI